MSIGISFGALSPSIEAQLNEQGHAEYDKETIEHLQRDSDAIIRLHVRGLLTDSQAHAARQKLIKRIGAAV